MATEDICNKTRAETWAGFPKILSKCIEEHEKAIDRSCYFVRVQPGEPPIKMGMVEVKTSDLHGAALNLAVAQAEGREVCLMRGGTYGAPNSLWYAADLRDGRKYDPAGDWAQGGPLIFKHRVAVDPCGHTKWQSITHGRWTDDCDSPLVAVCRAIVAAKLGDTVMVPADLVQVAA